MQIGHERRIATLELGVQAGVQQLVGAVPVATVVELDEEQVRPREALEHGARVLPAYDGVTQCSRHPLEDRSADHELTDRRLLSKQHLFHQVVDDVPVGAGKAGDELAAIRATAKRRRRQIETSRPALVRSCSRRTSASPEPQSE